MNEQLWDYGPSDWDKHCFSEYQGHWLNCKLSNLQYKEIYEAISEIQNKHGAIARLHQQGWILTTPAELC